MIDDVTTVPTEAALDKDYDDTADYRLNGPSHVGTYELSFIGLTEGERTYLVNTFEANRRRHRQAHQTLLRIQARRAAKIARLRDLFLQDKTWAAIGGNIAIKDMTPNHALNSYNLITREWTRYAGDGVSFADLGTGCTSVTTSPLATALLKRSQKRTTWRHKRQDNESRERYKDRLEKARALASRMWHEW